MVYSSRLLFVVVIPKVDKCDWNNNKERIETINNKEKEEEEKQQ